MVASMFLKQEFPGATWANGWFHSVAFEGVVERFRAAEYVFRFDNSTSPAGVTSDPVP